MAKNKIIDFTSIQNLEDRQSIASHISKIQADVLKMLVLELKS